MRCGYFFFTIILLTVNCMAYAQPLMVAGRTSQLDIRKAGEKSFRITLKPVSYLESFPFTPALIERKYDAPVITLKQNKALKKTIGDFEIEIEQKPLSVRISDKGRLIQKFI